jgi:2-alkenal reductase
MNKRRFTIILATLMVLALLACSPFALTPESVARDEEITDDDLTERIEAEVARQLAEQPEDVATAQVQGTIDTELEAVLTDLYARANPAVVFIVVGSGSGSGFVYNDEGYIVTNNHVVANGTDYEVVFANGTRQRADLVGTDVDSDLAVLQVDSLPEIAEPLPLAESDDIQVGQFVVAIGNPFGEQGSMSLGIVSGLGRSLPSQRGMLTGSTYSLPQVIQTDAPINPGNSGGPLLNLNGEVVGVNAAIASLTGTGSGVGFSIPVAAVRRIVPSLIEDGSYTYPYMGLAFDGEITLDEAEQYGLPQTQGAYVLEVVPDGPADEAGIVAADPSTGQGGDLIIALDDQTINNFDDLNTYLSFHTSVGQTIDVRLLRDGEEITLPLTLGARP